MLHKETVEPNTFQLLEDLSKKPLLSDFSLVGGTALSLQLGHRVSTDLDLFSPKDFDAEAIMRMLNTYGDVRYTATGKNLVQGFVKGIKVDFAAHKYDRLHQGIQLNQVQISSLEDISAMKLAAVLARAMKRDFVDIAALLQKTTLQQMLNSFKKKYKQFDTMHVLKAVGYFKDAELDKTPLKVLDSQLTWENSKLVISRAVNSLNKNRGRSMDM